MKNILTLLLFLGSMPVFGQEEYGIYEPDSLGRIKLEYEILDSIESINRYIHLRHKNYTNLIVYDEQGIIKVAYYTRDQKKWTTFALPFNRLTADFSLINLNRQGKKELVIKGETAHYGSGGGTGTKTLVIINLDSIPTSLFYLDYGCWDESFGDRQNEGEGRYYEEYEREIKITGKRIIIADLKPDPEFEFDCELTELPGGTYMMNKNGQVVRKDKE